MEVTFRLMLALTNRLYISQPFPKTLGSVSSDEAESEESHRGSPEEMARARSGRILPGFVRRLFLILLPSHALAVFDNAP